MPAIPYNSCDDRKAGEMSVWLQDGGS